MRLTLPRPLVASVVVFIPILTLGLSLVGDRSSEKPLRHIIHSNSRLSVLRQSMPKMTWTSNSDEIYSRHVLAVPYYDVSGGWTTELMLSNQAPVQMQAEITLFSLSGQKLHIPPVTLDSHQAEIYDLNQWVPSLVFQRGSLHVSYFGPERVLDGSVIITRAKRGLVFDQQLTEPANYYTSSQLEGMWWLPSNRSDVSVAVSNFSYAPLSVNITLYDPQGIQLGLAKVFLAAHETHIFAPNKIINDEDKMIPEMGGIRIDHTGKPGSVLSSVFIQDPAKGFSYIMPLQDPRAAVSSRLDGAGLRIGRVAGEELMQIAVARNVGDSDLVLRGRVNYITRDSNTGVIPIPEVNLKPGETSNVGLAKVIKASRVNDVVAAGLEFDYEGLPGSVLVSALSVSEGGNHVFRVPLVNAASRSNPSNSGKYHLKIDRDVSNLVYLKNVTDKPQWFTMSIEYPGGLYVPGMKKIEAGRTLIYDLKQLRDEQLPDEDGNTLPRNVRKGYLSWSARSADDLISGEMERGDNRVMIGRSEYADMVAGLSSTSSYGCACQPSYLDSWIEQRLPNGSWTTFSQTNLNSGETVQLRARQMDLDCGGSNTYTQTLANWSSEDEAKASISSSGLVTGAVLGGENRILAFWSAAKWLPLYECCEFLSWDVFLEGSVSIKAPSAFVPLSVTQTDLGCPTNPNFTRGFGAQVLYQVVDQDGNPFLKSGMTPMERFSVNGIWNSQTFSQFATPPTTDSNGRFLDTPIGSCFPSHPFSTSNNCVSVQQVFQLAVPNTPGSPVPIPTVTDRRDCEQGIRVEVTNASVTTFTLGTVP